MVKINKKNPKVSVVMPVYNAEKYVGEAIESILKQSFEDFEFIIIDDASTDKSFMICESYSKIDCRIKLFKNNQNKGISFTRNKLIEHALSNFIVTQDSDDISLEYRLDILYNSILQNENIAVISGNMKIINSQGKIIGKRNYLKDVSKIILKKSPISQPASIFRKDLFYKVGGYDVHLDYGEDYDLWLKFYSSGYNIQILDEYILYYRLHDTQSKKSKLRHTLKNTLYIQKRAIKEYNIKPSFSDYLYLFLEKSLLFLPENIVLFIFKKIEYKNAK